MTMDDTRVIHLKLNFVQTELPQTSSPSPFSPWPTRAKILAEFCRVFSSKTQVYCICTRRTTTTAYSTGISTVSQHYPGMVSMELMVLKAVPGAYTSDCPKNPGLPR